MTDPVAAYQASVERHLADLPDAIREDLIADFRPHLVQAASGLGPGRPLEHRLGSAEHTASRLRKTVELQPVGIGERLLRGFASVRLSLGLGAASQEWHRGARTAKPRSTA